MRISVPIHGNKSLKIGLLRHLLKKAGLEEDNNFESNLSEELIEKEIDENGKGSTNKD